MAARPQPQPRPQWGPRPHLQCRWAGQEGARPPAVDVSSAAAEARTPASSPPTLRALPRGSPGEGGAPPAPEGGESAAAPAGVAAAEGVAAAPGVVAAAAPASAAAFIALLKFSTAPSLTHLKPSPSFPLAFAHQPGFVASPFGIIFLIFLAKSESEIFCMVFDTSNSCIFLITFLNVSH